jgi:hypothetical protein
MPLVQAALLELGIGAHLTSVVSHRKIDNNVAVLTQVLLLGPSSEGLWVIVLEEQSGRWWEPLWETLWAAE